MSAWNVLFLFLFFKGPLRAVRALVKTITYMFDQMVHG